MRLFILFLFSLLCISLIGYQRKPADYGSYSHYTITSGKKPIPVVLTQKEKEFIIRMLSAYPRSLDLTPSADEKTDTGLKVINELKEKQKTLKDTEKPLMDTVIQVIKDFREDSFNLGQQFDQKMGLTINDILLMAQKKE